MQHKVQVNAQYLEAIRMEAGGDQDDDIDLCLSVTKENVKDRLWQSSRSADRSTAVVFGRFGHRTSKAHGKPGICELPGPVWRPRDRSRPPPQFCLIVSDSPRSN